MKKAEAKAQILALFDKKGTADYFDIMNCLDMDLELIIEICNELIDDGKLEEI